MFPTIVTGVDPGQHGTWGVKLKPEQGKQTLTNSFIDIFPDLVTTTFQCALHFSNSLFDLPAIPPYRRREFQITRTKYKRRNKRPEALSRIGGFETIFDIAGNDSTKYIFDSSMNPEKKIYSEVCNSNYAIEFLELYSLDRYQQWNMHKPEKINSFYNVIDKFLNKLNIKSLENSMKLLIISDHGHEYIKESINIFSLLKKLNLPKKSFRYFIEVSSIRLWFQNDESQNAIMSLLKNLNKGKILSYKDFPEYGISLKDKSYGEIFYYLDQGYIFFPHDFNQPLANFYFGLTDKMQRPRIFNPRHKGNHGHLPGFESEKSFVLFMDNNFKVNLSHPDILDIAPSILYLAGYNQPSTMKGKPIFIEKL